MTDYGRDVLCTDSLKTGRYASGIALVAWRCVHRLTTAKGQLRGGRRERDFGIDLQALCGAIVTDAQRAALPGQIRNELLKDEQVKSAEATVSESGGATDRTWTIAVSAKAAAGPFSFVMAVDSASAKVLQLVTE